MLILTELSLLSTTVGRHGAGFSAGLWDSSSVHITQPQWPVQLGAIPSHPTTMLTRPWKPPSGRLIPAAHVGKSWADGMWRLTARGSGVIKFRSDEVVSNIDLSLPSPRA